MTRLNLPTIDELITLANARSDVCVSIYLETSPLKLNRDYCRLELQGMIKKALTEIEAAGFDKRRLATLKQTLEEVAGPDDFCLNQANSLAILATPDASWVFNLANRLVNQLSISDRFYLKPLFRALTFSQKAYILALSENMVKVISLQPESEPIELDQPDLPQDALSALNLPSMTASHKGPENPVDGSERKMRLADYARKVNEALVSLDQKDDAPFILVATEPLASIFRKEATVKMTEGGVMTSPDKLSDSELIALARPVLDQHYQDELSEVRELFEQRSGQKLVAMDVAEVAKAATYGMISLVLVDFDRNISGYIDENGNIEFSDEPGSYGLIDEIVKRSLESGARILAVRQDDMVGDSGIAAVLRYPLGQTETESQSL